jgi:hypothetical protein
MSFRSLEPWERRLWAQKESQGELAAQESASEWCSLSPLQLREEIQRLKTDFRANWRQIAYLEGHLRVVDERFRDRRRYGASLRGHLESAKMRSLQEWF